jgi:uncharacterized protein YecT (DUF1311 family)
MSTASMSTSNEYDRRGKDMQMRNTTGKAASKGVGVQGWPWRRTDSRPLAELTMLVLLWFVLLPQPAQAASFDCAKAGTKIEKLICADEQLSKLDEQLAALYQEALVKTAYPDHLKAWQLQWLRDKQMGREACAGQLRYSRDMLQCLRSSYGERIAWFKDRLFKKFEYQPLPPTPEQIRAYEQRLRDAQGAKARRAEQLAKEALLEPSKLERMLHAAMPQTRPPTPEQEAKWAKQAQEHQERKRQESDERSILLRLPDGDVIRARTSKEILSKGDCDSDDRDCVDFLPLLHGLFKAGASARCPEPLTSHIERVRSDGAVLWRKMVIHWLKEPMPSLEDCDGVVPGDTPRTFSPPHEYVISLDGFGHDPGDGTLVVQHGAIKSVGDRRYGEPLVSAYPLHPTLTLQPVTARINLSDGSVVTGGPRTLSVNVSEIESFKRAFIRRYIGVGNSADRSALQTWFNEDFFQHFYTHLLK